MVSSLFSPKAGPEPSPKDNQGHHTASPSSPYHMGLHAASDALHNHEMLSPSTRASAMKLAREPRVVAAAQSAAAKRGHRGLAAERATTKPGSFPAYYHQSSEGAQFEAPSERMSPERSPRYSKRAMALSSRSLTLSSSSSSDEQQEQEIAMTPSTRAALDRGTMRPSRSAGDSYVRSSPAARKAAPRPSRNAISRPTTRGSASAASPDRPGRAARGSLPRRRGPPPSKIVPQMRADAHERKLWFGTPPRRKPTVGPPPKNARFYHVASDGRPRFSPHVRFASPLAQARIITPLHAIKARMAASPVPSRKLEDLFTQVASDDEHDLAFRPATPPTSRRHRRSELAKFYDEYLSDGNAYSSEDSDANDTDYKPRRVIGRRRGRRHRRRGASMPPRREAHRTRTGPKNHLRSLSSPPDTYGRKSGRRGLDLSLSGSSAETEDRVRSSTRDSYLLNAGSTPGPKVRKKRLPKVPPPTIDNWDEEDDEEDLNTVFSSRRNGQRMSKTSTDALHAGMDAMEQLTRQGSTESVVSSMSMKATKPRRASTRSLGATSTSSMSTSKSTSSSGSGLGRFFGKLFRKSEVPDVTAAANDDSISVSRPMSYPSPNDHKKRVRAHRRSIR